MAEEKKAKKVYTLEEIKFNEANKTMAIISCIPIVGLILMFVEKEDKFVRYMGAQFTILAVACFIITLIPVVGWITGVFLPLLEFVLVVVGMVKASKGERFDIPVVSGLALKLIALI